MFKFHVGTVMEVFYPISEESHDMQTIINTAQFITKTGLDKSLQYFQAGDRTIVLKTFRGINFVIVSNLGSPKLLAGLLQQVRNIAVFLFGFNFEEFMHGSISLAYQEVFSKYMDIYINMLKSDPRTLLGAIPHENEYTETSRRLSKKVPTTTIPENLQFVECILFNNHKIAGRLSSKTCKPLTCSEIFLLSLFERAEFPEESDPNPELIDPNFVTSVSPLNVKYRAGFFNIEGSSQRCSIAATRMGPNSSRTALFVTQNATANERRDLIMNILGVVTVSMKDGGNMPPKPTIFLPPSMVDSIIINRTTGECFESTLANSEKSKEILDALIRLFAIKTAEAIPRGFITMLWNDSLFDFCYEMRFEGANGFKEPSRAVSSESSVFAEGKILYYDKLADELFGPIDDLSVYEVYTIFMSTEQQSETITISRHVTEEIIKTRGISNDHKNKKAKARKSFSSFQFLQANHSRQGSQPLFNIKDDENGHRKKL